RNGFRRVARELRIGELQKAPHQRENGKTGVRVAPGRGDLMRIDGVQQPIFRALELEGGPFRDVYSVAELALGNRLAVVVNSSEPVQRSREFAGLLQLQR